MHLTDEQIQNYLDKTLLDTTSIDQHLQQCDECQAQLELYRIIANGFKKDSAPEMSAGFVDSVMKAIEPVIIPETVPAQKSFEWLTLFGGVGFAIVSIVSLIYFNGLDYFINTYKWFSDKETVMVDSLSGFGKHIFSTVGLNLQTALFIALILLLFGLLDRFLLQKRLKGMRVFLF